MNSRIGIFGGSFNPVHTGHVVVAIRIVEYLKLDKLLIVPTFSPPHRPKEDLAPFELRFKWLEESLGDIPKIEISDYEARKGGKSYSVETAEYFSRLYRTKPYFVIGEDWLPTLKTWYRYEDLINEVVFVVYPRFRKRIESDEKVIFLDDLPIVEISSTDVRERIRTGKSIRGMVPYNIEKEVIEYYER